MNIHSLEDELGRNTNDIISNFSPHPLHPTA
jgi:hypothetical protein